MKLQKETTSNNYAFNFNASNDVLNDLTNYISEGVSINHQQQTSKKILIQVGQEVEEFMFNHSGGGGRTAQQCQTYLKDKAKELSIYIIKYMASSPKQSGITKGEAIENHIKKIFTNIGAVTKLSGLNYVIAIEEDNKVQKIERLKDYLNNSCKFYLLSIQFRGGNNFENYETVARVEIVIQ